MLGTPAFFDLSENQTRQYIDAETVYRAWRQARKDAAEVRGSMLWREVSGKRYLIRTSPRSAQKSLGPESTATQQIFEKFMARKTTAESRLASLKAELATQVRLCRALRVGRIPSVVLRILNVLEDASVGLHFMVIGTHALYAYETAAGVRIQGNAMATRDVDLLFDSRQRLAFTATIEKTDSSLLSLLRKADPTFDMVPLEKCTLRTDKGFEVDVVRRMAGHSDPHPLRMRSDEDDIWPVQVSTGESLLSARKFEQLVVSVSGEMAVMRTVHPLDFVRIKRRLAKMPQRDSLKRGKDLLQADFVEQLVHERLPQWVGNSK